MKKTITTPLVDLALRTLDAEAVRRVQSWFERLRHWDSDDSIRRRTHSLEDMPGVYLLKTNPDLRIFFTIEGDTITILDVAKKAAIVTSGHVPENG